MRDFWMNIEADNNGAAVECIASPAEAAAMLAETVRVLADEWGGAFVGVAQQTIAKACENYDPKEIKKGGEPWKESEH